MYHYAITCTPAHTFAAGLTTANLGVPEFQKTLDQHNRYVQALETCGLHVEVLPPDDDYPDSTFVEDTAVLIPGCAILTNPGASSRSGEVYRIRPVIEKRFPRIHSITPPGTLDGGDICEVEHHFFIGISKRTNLQGAEQLAGFLASEGYSSSFILMNQITGLLHLKSGTAYIGDKNLILCDDFVTYPEFQGYNIIRVNPRETYAANCIRVNDFILIADGFPRLRADLEKLGYRVISLPMTEFQKMDGGLSCLSLRF